ncbi:MAG: DUF4366 domain-containing protein [Oscillospiraceae bacterium]|nr:DUF4366 domain-containing protein [Oscillospiraceae bacterium]
MKNKLFRLLAAALCVAAFSVTAFASEGSYYASDEKSTQQPPDSIDTIVVGTETVTMPEHQGKETITPDGNLTLIDDILQSYESKETTLSDKQFITVQSKNGNYFYLVIDRSGNTENVYFLNLVDEADLMALLEDGETETVIPVCSCTDRCAVGTIKTDCEICRINMSECIGKEPVVEPELAPTPSVDQAPTQTTPAAMSNPALLVAVLLVAGGGGFAVYWFKFRDSKPKTSGDSDLDDYAFGQDEDDDTEIDDAEDENENRYSAEDDR